MRRGWVLALLMALLAPAAGGQEGEVGIFELVSPNADEPVRNATPEIVVRIVDAAAIQVDTFQLFVGRIEASILEEYEFNGTHAFYQVPTLFKLKDGTHNITARAQAADPRDGVVETTWTITVDTRPLVVDEAGKTLQLIVIIGTTGLAVALVGLVGTYVYLRKTRRFTLEKFFARHPAQREYLILYVPLVLGVAMTWTALAFVQNYDVGVPFAAEYVLVGGGILTLMPFAIDTKRSQARRRAYERAYAQFLFELADSMRGGIDPQKAVLELAETETGILRTPLRVAADGIKLGRPFDGLMRTMAKQMRSNLIERYAAIVGEAAKVGGNIATVVHRAAKDMDDLVKIDAERASQLKAPLTTMYIAFGVLLMMVKSLMDFAPDLAATDFVGLNAGLDAAAQEAPTRMALPELQQRFFHLTLFVSLGTGLLIGSFTEGRLRHGLVHAFIMVGAAATFYHFVILG